MRLFPAQDSTSRSTPDASRKVYQHVPTRLSQSSETVFLCNLSGRERRASSIAASLPFSAHRICRVQSRSAPSAAQRRDRFYGKRSKRSPKGGPGRLGVFHFSFLRSLKILKAESMMMLFLLFGNNDWERGDFCYDLLPAILRFWKNMENCDVNLMMDCRGRSPTYSCCAGRRRRQHGDRPSRQQSADI